ncbi:MAG: YqgE/AlgH family protein [Opitutales bacterium]|jgi:putative transcriptional regulator
MPPAPSGLAGRLLVSHPSLRDDNFRESVVLLHSHSPAEGAMGVIINRPMQSVLADASPVLAGTPLAGMPLFQGGPVSADRFAIGGWRWLSAVDAELRYGLEREAAEILAASGVHELRAYVGYSGWSPGQLENELRLNAWVICPFTQEIAASQGEAMWKALLRLHAPDLLLQAGAPDDPGLN